MQGFSNNSLGNKLVIMGTAGTENMLKQIEGYIREWRCTPDENFIVQTSCPRFSSGEGKGLIKESVRDKDVYILCDCFNYGVEYKMYGRNVPMSPDDHFQDLKRIISAIGGKASRISVIMPMLYEGRQHRVSGRESLDCAMALKELEDMGVENIVTFDAHDDRIKNAVPFIGFDNLMPTYQNLKAFVHDYDDVDLSNLIVVSPDEGALNRGMYYAYVMGIKLSMFYKRRDYSVVENGRNPIVAHEYLGDDVNGKDIIVVDDILSTGDSFLHIIDKLKGMGAKRIFGFFSFGLFTNGLEIFDQYYEKNLFDRIYTTNSVYVTDELKSKKWFTEVNVLKYVAYYIEALNKHNSVSKLLDSSERINALLAELKARNTSVNVNQMSIENN
ncbi:MAG: ribose-phosphate diphosphokinase [Ruminococcaceae bacterium]|nr:ribose-phosphate diphosphokinase [Oscillospiraceae bacterium]